MKHTKQLIAALQPPDRLSMWDWVCREVDFSRDPRYRAAWPGRYNPNLMPFYRELIENFDNLNVREMVLLKPSQIGGSEHTILMPLRYAIARLSICALYVSAQQETTEQFYIERIARGMTLAEESARAWANRKERGYVVEAGASMIIHTWAKSGTGIKQRPVDWCFGDELSTWPDVGVIDELRKRSATRPNPKLVIIGTPDVKQKRSSDDDPIFIEYKATDQRRWMMRLPGGNPFAWEFGAMDSAHGVKWDASCKHGDEWDLDEVRRTAHYITPDGTRIDEVDRRATTASGEWVPTAKGQSFRRGYHMNQMMLPFEFGGFGHMAVSFLEAKRKGPTSLRAFVYESLAESWAIEVERAYDDALLKRERDYQRNGEFTDDLVTGRGYVFVTVDVQKLHMWYVVREWFPGGHSRLIDWGSKAAWEDINALADKHNAVAVYIDNTYPKRSQEVLEAALTLKFVPVVAKDSLQSLPFVQRVVDPYEGTTRQGARNKVGTYVWNPNVFKPLVLDMVNGESPCQWYVYKGIEREYVRQVLSEECTAAGEWQVRRGYVDNHLWDCEVLQLLAATISGVHRLKP